MPAVKVKENEPFDVALRRFKRSCEKAGVLSEVRRREHYEKPTWVRKRKAAAAVKRHLKKLQRELGISFIHVTHGQDEALALADEIIVMNDARIEQAGPARDVFNRPKTAFVARFMGGHNVLNLPQGNIALRTDEMTVTAAQAGRTDGRVIGSQHQGTHPPPPSQGRCG